MPEIVYPFAPPEPGHAIGVAPGILWARLPLPYAPGHVNAYLIEDGSGWLAVDVGLDDEPTRAAWDALLGGPLGGGPLTRVLVTHWHSDHMGLAGWLCRRFDAELLMSETEYLHGVVRHFTPQAVKGDIQRRFFRSHGLDPETTEEWVRSGHRHLEMLTSVPRTFRRLMDGDGLTVGGRRFQVFTAGGHSPEAVMLYDAASHVFLAADQVIARIVPNVAVQPIDPEGDPLAVYMRSLERLDALIPQDALVLPGHDLVYRGVAERIRELTHHVAAQGATIVAACRGQPRSAADLLPLLFRKRPSPVWIGFVVSDVLAHLHHAAASGLLRRVKDDGVVRFVATQDQP